MNVYGNQLNKYILWIRERHGDLMVSKQDCRVSGLVSSPGQGHCVVFLDRTLSSQVYTALCTSKFNVGFNPAVD